MEINLGTFIKHFGTKKQKKKKTLSNIIKNQAYAYEVEGLDK